NNALPTCTQITQNPYDLLELSLSQSKGANQLTSVQDMVFLIRYAQQLPLLPRTAQFLMTVLTRSPLTHSHFATQAPGEAAAAPVDPAIVTALGGPQ
ncbi:hypothetical protein KIPB_014227, partial [Kipferlia bialata]